MKTILDRLRALRVWEGIEIIDHEGVYWWVYLSVVVAHPLSKKGVRCPHCGEVVRPGTVQRLTPDMLNAAFEDNVLCFYEQPSTAYYADWVCLDCAEREIGKLTWVRATAEDTSGALTEVQVGALTRAYAD